MSTVIITGIATLRVLGVSRNDISDDGMAVISEALQHGKSLTALWVAECGLSVKGTVMCIQVNNQNLIEYFLIPCISGFTKYTNFE